MREYGMGAIVFPDVLTDDGIVAASQTGWEFQVHGGVIHLIHLDRYYLLQLFHLLLHLYGFGGLIAEALDKGAHLGYLLLLVLVGTLLLFAAFLSKHHIFIVAHLIVYDVSTRYL